MLAWEPDTELSSHEWVMLQTDDLTNLTWAILYEIKLWNYLGLNLHQRLCQAPLPDTKLLYAVRALGPELVKHTQVMVVLRQDKKNPAAQVVWAHLFGICWGCVFDVSTQTSQHFCVRPQMWSKKAQGHSGEEHLSKRQTQTEKQSPHASVCPWTWPEKKSCVLGTRPSRNKNHCSPCTEVIRQHLRSEPGAHQFCVSTACDTRGKNKQTNTLWLQLNHAFWWLARNNLRAQ